LLDDPSNGDDHHHQAIELRPNRQDNNVRLDRFVAQAMPELSRSYLQTLIEEGAILVDGIQRRPSFKMTVGQIVTVAVPDTVESEMLPEALPLEILHEDDDVLVVNKEAGMVVHPAPGHATGTLVNALLHHAPGISIGGGNRPGIVHRLDKDTSGVMVVAKTDRGQLSLLEQWGRKSVVKEYAALVAGVVEEEAATIDAPIGRDRANRLRMAAVRGGREAVSHFTVRERFARSTLLDVTIDTGRTHQIRVHLAMIGHPVVGDRLYGTSTARAIAAECGLDRQFLHASRLTFKLPGDGRRSFAADLPPDLLACLACVSGNTGADRGT
jgi:23S rRNA pseudouridine1911/1915/1917 synthase